MDAVVLQRVLQPVPTEPVDLRPARPERHHRHNPGRHLRRIGFAKQELEES